MVNLGFGCFRICVLMWFVVILWFGLEIAVFGVGIRQGFCVVWYSGWIFFVWGGFVSRVNFCFDLNFCLFGW